MQVFCGYNQYAIDFEKMHRNICEFEKKYPQLLVQVKPSIDGFFTYLTVSDFFRSYLMNKSRYLINGIVNRISTNLFYEIINTKLECCQNKFDDIQNFDIHCANQSCIGIFEFFKLIEQKYFVNLADNFEFNM